MNGIAAGHFKRCGTAQIIYTQHRLPNTDPETDLEEGLGRDAKVFAHDGLSDASVPPQVLVVLLHAALTVAIKKHIDQRHL